MTSVANFKLFQKNFNLDTNTDTFHPSYGTIHIHSRSSWIEVEVPLKCNLKSPTEVIIIKYRGTVSIVRPERLNSIRTIQTLNSCSSLKIGPMGESKKPAERA